MRVMYEGDCVMVIVWVMYDGVRVILIYVGEQKP